MFRTLISGVARPAVSALAVSGALIIAGLGAYSYAWQKGFQSARAEYTEQALRASEVARVKEREWQAQLQEAQNEARAREAKIQNDVDSVRLERNRLREQLANTRNRLSSASVAALYQYASTLDNVFQQCAGRLEEVARAADWHASDSVMLLQSQATLAPKR